MSIRINMVVADDHPVFLTGLKQVLSSEPACRILAEADDGEKALAAIRTHTPDIALLDFDLPKLNGLEILRALRREHSTVRVILLTMHQAESVIREALDAGVSGYVLKDNATTDLLRSLRTVADGGTYLSPSISAGLISWTKKSLALRHQEPGIATLTPTERRILRLIAARKTSRDIGRELFISHRTVETHRSHICDKLALSGSNCLLQFAIEHRDEL